MGFIQGERRDQHTLFPTTLDDLIPADHMCRVIEAFVGKLEMSALGFVRAEPAETGRPGYDPRDLLKLYLYGYLQQIRSSRRLEAECRRNVEVMWLLSSLEPDYKSIAEFRRMHSEAVTEAGSTPMTNHMCWLSSTKPSEPKSTFELEHRVIRADSSLGWTFSRAVPLLNTNGEITEWFGAASDVTVRKLAEEALRHSEERLWQFIEESPAALAVFDREMRYVCASRRWLSDYQLGDRNLRGVSHYDIFPEIGEEWKESHRRGLAGEVTSSACDCFQRANGSVQWIRWEIRPWRNAAGEVGGILLFSEDITEHKLAEEALLRSEKLAVTGRLAATIAHEVNNPLSAAMNAVYIASTDPTQASEMLKLAEQELRHAAHITQQTLGFYRESNSRIQPIALPKLIDEVLDVYAGKLKNRNITVQRRCYCAPSSRRGRWCPENCENCEGRLLVNSGELRQIISNLLANGIDALSDGGVIQIRVSRLSDRLRLAMADNGCGIRTEHLKRVFEPFFTTKKTVGTGLGLWVTQEIVRKHNGVIKVRSRKDKGTVFWIAFSAIPLPTGESGRR